MVIQPQMGFQSATSGLYVFINSSVTYIIKFCREKCHSKVLIYILDICANVMGLIG